ncbi:diaminobutyrate--2-oxoglutarate transaminase family protein [Streptacidiphilus monticola]
MPAAAADAAAILTRQAARESAARTYARSLPIVPVRARGMTVEGADGRRYLDCLAGAGTLALGHNHPVVLEAIRGVLDTEAPLHVLDLATPVKDDFTTALFETLPPEFAADARVQFCGPAGTDAVEAALKLVRTATGRSGLLAFTGGYHGMTAGALAATGDRDARVGLGGVAERGWRGGPAALPYDYRCPFGLGGEEGARLGARWTASLLDDPKGGIEPPAGMLVEPVQGRAGSSRSRLLAAGAAPDHRTSRHPADRRRGADGVGRTGRFWGFQHAGIIPDVVVVSKAVGGSLPLAAIVYRSELDVWAPGAHAGTFRGNQMAMAAGAATLRFVRREQLEQRAEELGGRMLRWLRGLQGQLPVIGDVRGRGLMLGVELVDPERPADALGAHPAAPELAHRVRAEALARGLLVELGGRHGSVVRLLPPLTITDEQAEAVLTRLADAILVASGQSRASSREPAPGALGRSAVSAGVGVGAATAAGTGAGGHVAMARAAVPGSAAPAARGESGPGPAGARGGACDCAGHSAGTRSAPTPRCLRGLGRHGQPRCLGCAAPRAGVARGRGEPRCLGWVAPRAGVARGRGERRCLGWAAPRAGVARGRGEPRCLGCAAPRAGVARGRGEPRCLGWAAPRAGVARGRGEPRCLGWAAPRAGVARWRG